uniref:Uncharacterized protein n=1 Tax=Timema bartmani TaxID=61472 RepID=A0A7R9HZ87_9NEOP|nr:unnamed protein product [Timema bartmani]
MAYNENEKGAIGVSQPSERGDGPQKVGNHWSSSTRLANYATEAGTWMSHVPFNVVVGCSEGVGEKRLEGGIGNR